MEGPRHAVTAAALAAVAAIAVSVTVNVAMVLKTSGWAWVAVGVVMVVSGSAAAYLTWSSRGRAKQGDVEDAFTALAETVKRRLDEAVDHRGLGAHQLIDVRWETRPYRGETKATRAVAAADGAAGLADVVLGEKARILVIGPAGAGKSSLARRMALKWAGSAGESHPVPIVLTVSTWSAGESVPSWIERQLSLLHPGLGRKTEAGATIASALITAKRILPVIDGLDEVPEAPQAGFCAALHGAALEELPLILTCRTDPDTDPVTVLPPLPVDAVLTMAPVKPARMLATLRVSASQSQRDSWDRVIAVVKNDPKGSMAETLSRPLMVAMAAQVYQREAPKRDPEELITAADPAEHILGAWIPAVLQRQRSSSAGPSARREDKVLRWLTFLARHIDRRETHDFRWWELRTALSARASLAYMAIAAAVVVCVAAWNFVGPLRALGAGACVAVFVAFDFVGLRPPGQPQQIVTMRPGRTRAWLRSHRRRVRPRLARRFATGFLGGCGLIWGMGALLWALSFFAPGFVHQALSGGGVMPDLLVHDPFDLLVLVSLGLGLFMGALIALSPVDQDIMFLKQAVLEDRPDDFPGASQGVEFDQATSPRHTLAQDRRWTLLRLVIGASSIYLVIQLSFIGGATQAFPLLRWAGEHLALWIVCGMVVVVVQVFLHAEWPWFAAARIRLALGGELPFRLIAFLDEMDAVDIVRREGDVYRFRHPVLRDWLLAQAAKERYASLDGERQRFLRRLAVPAGPDVTADLAAYLEGVPVAEAWRSLEDCRRAEFFTRADDRFAWRAGCRLAIVEATRAAVDPPGTREQILGAVKAYYRRLLAAPEGPMSLPGKSWRQLRADRRSVVASVHQAVRDGDFEYAADIALSIAPYLTEWGYEAEGQDLLEAVRDCPVPPLTALRLRYQLLYSDVGDAAEVVRRARSLDERDRELAAWCMVAYSTRDLATAAAVVWLCDRSGDSTGLLWALLCFGQLSREKDPDEAERYYRRAERLARKHDLRFFEAHALFGIGTCLLSRGRPMAAARSLRSALRIYQAMGAVRSTILTYLRLADIYFVYNHLAAAHRALWATIPRSLEIGASYHLAQAYSLQGETFYLEKDPFNAAWSLHRAKTLYTQCGDKQSEALMLLLSGASLVDFGNEVSSRKEDGEWAVSEGWSRLGAARQALADLGEPAAEARALLELGRRATSAGDARQWLSQAVEKYESVDRDDQARWLEEARTLLKSGRPVASRSAVPAARGARWK
ncbi:NACHT domain-containing protein [Amycolatopsis umgeniensis]|uniref:Tetratricopeptide (TPR) repeat protein n=1 Tax=Amycolatopsis umgeniensis TaxID=336628 RepID=A0A841BFQ6_9PSEU|nr:NACHT domain-containing protein [Amycolatopsis umgeniensis]MBB5857543.1 tetratricopeptide (TPR) repeat protein [Amycolatopsis umgeniensis]